MKKLRLLLDENIGTRTVSALREAGFDVTSILEDAPGATDIEVLKRAKKERQVVVTLDRDFGTLIFRDSERHVGVLLLRLQKENSENIQLVLVRVLAQYGDKLIGAFTVASETVVRIRRA